MLLEYDPSVVSAGRVIDLLAAHGYVIRSADTAGRGWADNVASAAMNWVINALAECLALAVITALVSLTRAEQCQLNSA